MLVTGRSKVCNEICDVFGLKNCRVFDLHMASSDIVTVRVEFMVEEEDLKKLIPILKEYSLVEKTSNEEKDIEKESETTGDAPFSDAHIIL